MKKIRNLKVFAENKNGAHGFNVYLDFSGRKEYLCFSRHNAGLYDYLKDGVRADDLERGLRCNACRGRARNKFENSVRRLSGIIEEYLEYEYAEADAA